jgi:hypothetical protein
MAVDARARCCHAGDASRIVAVIAVAVDLLDDVAAGR